MRQLFVSIDEAGRGRRAFIRFLWITVCLLAVLAGYQIFELRVAREELARVSPHISAPTLPKGASAAPSAAELSLANALQTHASARFATWNEALTSLEASLPNSVLVEQLTLNAKTKRAEATVRVERVDQVSRTVEALEAAPSFSGATARRCEQARTRLQLGMRCDLAFNWGRSSQ